MSDFFYFRWECVKIHLCSEIVELTRLHKNDLRSTIKNAIKRSERFTCSEPLLQALFSMNR